MLPNLIVILGPTASGKTKLATSLAYSLNTEIISADSRQVYTGMNIGTGKDLEEYTVNNTPVPYHLIDIVPAGSRYHINRFTIDFFSAFEHIRSGNKIPVLCGGTGLYIDAILNNYEYTSIPVNESLREQLKGLSREELEKMLMRLPHHPHVLNIDTSTAKRLIRGIEIISYLNNHSFKPNSFTKIHPVIFGTQVPPGLRRKNIEARLEFRLDNGLIEEVEQLLLVLTKEQLLYYGLEYKFITQYLTGEFSFEQMKSLLLIAIQQFAKRQMTWFRKMERDGKKIHWVDATQPADQQLAEVKRVLENKQNTR